MEFTSHLPGTFCWADLATSDTSAAKDFYTKLFGWEIFDMTQPDESTYTMMNLNGKSSTALYKLYKEQSEMGVPPHWMSYITTEDINAVLEKVTANGGTIIMPAWNASDFGIGAMIQDPEGAMLGLWQPKQHIGTSWKHIHGAYSWFEYASHGNEATIPFYENTFGYTHKTVQNEQMVYTTFYLGEEAVAGHYIMPENMQEIPAHWLVYYTVEDLDKSLEIVTTEGGEVLMPKLPVQGIGSFAVIRDPQGAVCGLVEYEKQ